MQPAASLIIPVKRQRQGWLRQCVLSALKQTLPCEVIVVSHKDTQPDNVKFLAGLESAYPNFRHIVRKSDNDGFAAAINLGWRDAKTDRIGLLLSDDWLDPAAVELCMACDTDIVSTGMIYHGARDCVFLENRLDMNVFNSFNNHEAQAGYLKHFLVFRKTKLEEIGGVDEHIGTTGADDYDLVWTLLEAGASVAITAQPLYHYRDHRDDRLSLRDRHSQILDMRKILDKHGVDPLRREVLLRQKSQWFGRTISETLEELQYRDYYWHS